MSSSEASAVAVAVPEPEALIPLVVEMKMETSEKDHGVAQRRRRLEMRHLNLVASATAGGEGGKRARPALDLSPAAVAGVVRPKSLSHGVHMAIGSRRQMEDAVAVAAPLPVVVAAAAGEESGEVEEGGSNGKGKEMEVEEGDGGWVPEFFAVYDGHGESWVAEMCRERLHVVLSEEMARLHLAKGGGGGGVEEAGALWKEAMVAAFARVDGEVAVIQVAEGDVKRNTEGSTAVVVVVEPRRIVVANCGDSRAVLCRGGVPVPLSTDHKPERPDERVRIESVGGQIIYWQGPRVMGVLAVSRSIGDYFMKPSISAEPEITVTDRTSTDELIILGSDGLWNAMSNEYACKVARYCLSGRAAAKWPAAVQGSSASDAAKLLVELAMARGSHDNVSVVVVELRRMLWRKFSRQNGRT
nr:unnamed protein product [Digitaria exilis]